MTPVTLRERGMTLMETVAAVALIGFAILVGGSLLGSSLPRCTVQPVPL